MQPQKVVKIRFTIDERFQNHLTFTEVKQIEFKKKIINVGYKKGPNHPGPFSHRFQKVCAAACAQRECGLQGHLINVNDQ